MMTLYDKVDDVTKRWSNFRPHVRSDSDATFDSSTGFATVRQISGDVVTGVAARSWSVDDRLMPPIPWSIEIWRSLQCILYKGKGIGGGRGGEEERRSGGWGCRRLTVRCCFVYLWRLNEALDGLPGGRTFKQAFRSLPSIFSVSRAGSPPSLWGSRHCTTDRCRSRQFNVYVNVSYTDFRRDRHLQMKTSSDSFSRKFDVQFRFRSFDSFDLNSGRYLDVNEFYSIIYT